jgi:hypothetical protein
MALDRGRLAKIDRRVFAELDHADGVQAVKVPVSDAVWSTWRRYCDAMGLSMGDGVAELILDELESVIDVDGAHNQVFAEQASRQAEEWTAKLDARQHALDRRAETLKRKEEHLWEWERRLGTPRVGGVHTQNTAKVGRNDRCPCGSGLKYKHCHGLPGRSG